MNYSYAEMKKMQEQAFERVKEMQRLADLTAKQAMSELAAQPQEAERAGEPPRRIPDQTRRISMPVEFPDRPQTATPAEDGMHKNILRNFFGMNDTDQETALLLSLMMLLNAENADKELLFALMYILNG